MITTVVNLREEPYDVYIGRGSIWGNPFTHLAGPTKATEQVATREEAIERYEARVRSSPVLMSKLSTLAGKRLGCYCKPKPCHGDVLIKLLREKGLE